jgi:hypothetical protein
MYIYIRSYMGNIRVHSYTDIICIWAIITDLHLFICLRYPYIFICMLYPYMFIYGYHLSMNNHEQYATHLHMFMCMRSPYTFIYGHHLHMSNYEQTHNTSAYVQIRTIHTHLHMFMCIRSPYTFIYGHHLHMSKPMFTSFSAPSLRLPCYTNIVHPR